MSELVPLHIFKILQSRAYTVVIVGTEEKKFAIYAEPHVGEYMQMQLAKTEATRPSTFTLIEQLLEGTQGKILQVVITDVQETTYFARLFVEQPQDGVRLILEMDARPSDCLILALHHKTPIFCTREALAKTIAVED